MGVQELAEICKKEYEKLGLIIPDNVVYEDIQDHKEHARKLHQRTEGVALSEVVRIIESFTDIGQIRQYQANTGIELDEDNNIVYRIRLIDHVSDMDTNEDLLALSKIRTVAHEMAHAWLLVNTPTGQEMSQAVANQVALRRELNPLVTEYHKLGCEYVRTKIRYSNHQKNVKECLEDIFQEPEQEISRSISSKKALEEFEFFHGLAVMAHNQEILRDIRA